MAVSDNTRANEQRRLEEFFQHMQNSMESLKEQMQHSMEEFRSQQRHELERLKDFVTGLSMEVLKLQICRGGLVKELQVITPPPSLDCPELSFQGFGGRTFRGGFIDVNNFLRSMLWRRE